MNKDDFNKRRLSSITKKICRVGALSVTKLTSFHFILGFLIYDFWFLTCEFWILVSEFWFLISDFKYRVNYSLKIRYSIFINRKSELDYFHFVVFWILESGKQVGRKASRLNLHCYQQSRFSELRSLLRKHEETAATLERFRFNEGIYFKRENWQKWYKRFLNWREMPCVLNHIVMHTEYHTI